jgi:DNA-binding response OmpR family regulator
MAHIILVEDDSIVSDLVADALEGIGHSVCVVGDGAAAEETIELERPDIIILDCNLPNRSGLLILQDLRAPEILKRIPVLMLTSRRSEWHVKIAMDLGADAYIRKPFLVEDLIGTLASLT